MDSATRGSRLVLRALSEPSPVPTRIRSPSRSTHTGAACGEPSGRSVARWAKLAPRKSALTSSESATPTRGASSGVRGARVHDHHAALAQVRVHVHVLPALLLPAFAGRRVGTLAPLSHATIHDDADPRVVAELALEVLVELRIVARHDEDLAELHHLLAAAAHPERHVHAAEHHEGGDEILLGALAIAA